MKNGEKGQALPLALLALAAGMLVIAPFLGHASSSLIGSGVYAEAIAHQSACDAGIEHAIWSLTRGILAEQFTVPGDEVTYQLDETVNGLTTTVTITANVTPSVVGEIADAVIDTFDFDNTNCHSPNIVNIAGNIYAVAYEGPVGDGFVRTLTIAPDGNITNSAIDTLEFDTSDGLFPVIIQISGNIYAIAYQGTGDDGFLKTVSIDSVGNIGDTAIDTLEFDTGNGREPDILNVSGNVYAIVYRGDGNDGFIITVSIAANGDIASSVIDTLEYDTSDGFEPDIIQVSGNIFAIAYRGSGSDGFIKTVSIAANGDIANSVIDTLEYDTSDGYSPDIIHVSGDTYAVAYEGSGSDSFLATMTISSGGAISNSVIDSWELDPSNGQEPSIIYIGGDVYAVAYRGFNSDGFLKTVAVAANGDITGSAIDTLEFDTSNGYMPDIIHISGDIFAIAYSVPSSKGSLKTVGITTTADTAAAYEIVATTGLKTIRAFVNTDNVTASIVSWQIE
jgi:hypothetical protein